MDSDSSSKSVVLYAMAANIAVAAVKYVVAFMTQSAAMMAEAVHSTADSLNQVLLLVGIKKGRDPLMIYILLGFPARATSGHL